MMRLCDGLVVQYIGGGMLDDVLDMILCHFFQDKRPLLLHWLYEKGILIRKVREEREICWYVWVIDHSNNRLLWMLKPDCTPQKNKNISCDLL